MGYAFSYSASCSLSRKPWLLLPWREFRRPPGSFTASAWAKINSRSVWSSLLEWIRGRSLINRKARKISQQIHANKNGSRARRFSPTVRNPLVCAAGAAFGALPKAIAFRLGLGFGEIHGAFVRRTKNAGQDFLLQGHLVLRTKEIAARRVEPDQATRLLAAKTRALRFAP